MTAVPRRQRIDLQDLRLTYDNLPHRNVRWNTVPGQEFLSALAEAVDLYGRRTVAEALARSVQGVEYMLGRRRLHRPSMYPTPADLKNLLAAWVHVQAASELGKTVHRYDDAFVPVYDALEELTGRFELGLVALAAKIPIRKLKRFVHEPLPHPTEVARAIREAMSKES